jgi:uncharacterized membrane protein YphA (DoxX/SURF4 family)/thiol-disulfide isomerase/thioredoxin
VFRRGLSATVELALLLARLLLAAVFLLAGVAKFFDPQGATKAFTGFGVPRAMAALFALLLPLVEVAVAVALLPAASAWYGACAALALLGIFVSAIVINLARGRRPDCHCFGQLHTAPVGRSTLMRNAVLGAFAAWLVAMGPARIGPSLWQHLASAGDNERRLFIVAAIILCFLVWRATRRSEPQTVESVSLWDDDDDEVEEPSAPRTAAPLVRERPPKRPPPDPELQRIIAAGMGWPIGTPARDFTLPDITGQECSLQSLRDQGKTICLVFVSPHCDPCKALWPYIAKWMREYDAAVHMAVITRGAAAVTLAKQNNVDPSRVLLQKEFVLSEAYGITSTPAAVLVGAEGRIQSGLAVGREEIRKLIAGTQSPSSSWYADTSKEKHS